MTDSVISGDRSQPMFYCFAYIATEYFYLQLELLIDPVTVNNPSFGWCNKPKLIDHFSGALFKNRISAFMQEGAA